MPRPRHVPLTVYSARGANGSIEPFNQSHQNDTAAPSTEPARRVAYSAK